jgi:hypothetical protein
MAESKKFVRDDNCERTVGEEVIRTGLMTAKAIGRFVTVLQSALQ